MAIGNKLGSQKVCWQIRSLVLLLLNLCRTDTLFRILHFRSHFG